MAPTDVMQGNDSDNESCDSDDYCLPWLFDPHRIDHLPISEQIKFYKERDLRKVKIFKIATQIWGVSGKRKRMIVAPPMDKGNNQKSDCNFRPPRPMNSELKPQKPPEKLPSEAEVNAWEQQKKIDDYKKWIAERKKFRNDLETMGLQEDWLARKPDKTALEQRVLRQMILERTPHAPTPPPIIDVPLNAILPEECPTVKRPSPLAIHIIEQFLQEKKLRLIDLFAAADKDKDWLISRDEFRGAVQGAKIPISEVLLEDLILALDTDLNDQLDYRELAKGMGLWKIEKRESKRKLRSSCSSLTPHKLSQLSGLESPDLQPSLGSITPIGMYKDKMMDEAYDAEEYSDKPSEVGSSPVPVNGRTKSAISTISSASSLLTPPPPDVRQERRMYTSDEAMVDQRKRNKDVLKLQKKKDGSSRKVVKPLYVDNVYTIIKTGEKAVDDHCSPSTLGGLTADQVNRFRQLKLREYNEIMLLCQKNNIILTKELLEKVLLYPRDKTVKRLQKNIRQPGGNLISSTFSEPAKRPNSPKPVHKTKGDRVKRTNSGRVMATGGRGSYPSAKDVAPVLQKMNLSTGKAHVRRHVDCWMSFEEYDKLTQNLAQKYTHLHGPSDDNAFWPGHLLNKLKLHMPNTDPKTATMFSSVVVEKKIYPGFDNNLRGWAQNDAGFIQTGDMDPYTNQNIF